MVPLRELAGHRADLLPELVHVRALRAAEEVMDAAVEGVTFASPGGALAARGVMLLEDAGVVSVQLPVDAGGQTTHPGADDDDLLRDSSSAAMQVSGSDPFTCIQFGSL